MKNIFKPVPDNSRAIPCVSQILIQDLPAVAEVHAAAFPEAALTLLGVGAVERYYDWQLNGPHQCTALGIWLGQRLVGFCFGGVFHGALSGFVRRNRSYLAFQVLMRPWVCARTSFRKQWVHGLPTVEWNRLFKKKKRTTHKRYKNRIVYFGVLSLAVHPQYQGRGYGRLLMEKMEMAALNQGFGFLELTVNPDNIAGVSLYKKMGWKMITKGEAWDGRMVKELAQCS